MRSFYFPVYPGCILVSGSQSKGFLCACSSRWEDGLGREALQEDPPGRERPVPHLDEPAAGQEAQGQAARQEGRQVQEQEGHGLVTGTDPKDIGSASTCWNDVPRSTNTDGHVDDHLIQSREHVSVHVVFFRNVQGPCDHQNMSN